MLLNHEEMLKLLQFVTEQVSREETKNLEGPYGPISGIRWEITQSGESGIGSATRVKDLQLGVTKDITDYNCW